MNYGFVIDNRRCIGCHACSTACKSENEVPLGVNRTWVKYVEQGAFPDVRRSFQVTRCNHCDNPPCVRICPVSAMVQRDDGIVDFDKDACIGCKACMQACPYDSIHIDPNSGTAAKCNFCAHRVEVGLEPACAVVCPTHAILAGDLDDPHSEVGRAVAMNRVVSRKPEQGTKPKLLYIEGDRLALDPSAFEVPPRQMIFSDAKQDANVGSHDLVQLRKPAPSDAGNCDGGSEGKLPRPTRAEQMVQLAYNAQHEMPWHWPVPAYLVTKGIGSGVFLFLAAGLAFGWFEVSLAMMSLAGLVGVLATLLTTALLVYDLERPERFLSILLRPQWRSWLTRGAFALIAFSTVSSAWWAFEAAGFLGWFDPPSSLRMAAAITTIPLAILAAIYTAFLFAQAEGRDLWQSPLLPFHLLVQALMLGSGTVVAISAFVTTAPDLASAAQTTLVATLVLDLFVTLAGEFGVRHASETAVRAARDITHGRYRHPFWIGSITIGHLVPLALLTTTSFGMLHAAAAVAAAGGLYAYEYAFVMAPQRIANS